MGVRSLIAEFNRRRLKSIFPNDHVKRLGELGILHIERDGWFLNNVEDSWTKAQADAGDDFTMAARQFIEEQGLTLSNRSRVEDYLRKFLFFYPKAPKVVCRAMVTLTADINRRYGRNIDVLDCLVIFAIKIRSHFSSGFFEPKSV